jgi:hypothetical protein
MNSVVGRAVSTIEQFWSDKTRQLSLLSQIEKKLRIRHPNDWYNFGEIDFARGDHRASVLLDHYNNSLPKLLSTLYPQEQWDLSRYNITTVQY